MPKLEILPSAIQQLFRRTFSYTATIMLSNKGNRTTAKEWMMALAKVAAPGPNAHLITCEQNPKHVIQHIIALACGVALRNLCDNKYAHLPLPPKIMTSTVENFGLFP